MSQNNLTDIKLCIKTTEGILGAARHHVRPGNRRGPPALRRGSTKRYRFSHPVVLASLTWGGQFWTPEVFASIMEWLSYYRTPWASYWSLMEVCLIGLYKYPSVIPVGISETWWHWFTKCILDVSGSDTKEACRTDQIFSGLEAFINVGIRGMRLMWEQCSQEEYWGFILIDMHNAFNKDNRTTMLWEVRNKRPSGAQFTFYCFCH